MAQDTWGLKLDSELKEKVQDIIKNDFDSSKDFLENVVSLYELNKLKQGENVLSAEIDELESLTRRINNIFINANARINTMLEDKDLKAQEQLSSKEKLIVRLQADISRAEEEKEKISSINDDLVNLNNEYLQQVNQLTKNNQTLEDLVSEYKEKNDTLTGTLSEYKAEHELNKQLKEQVQELNNKINELNMVTTEQASKIIDYDSKLIALEERHKGDLQAQRDRFDIDINKAILDLEKRHQSDLKALQDKHNKEIESYQQKYKELLEKLEEKKTTKRTTKAKAKEEVQEQDQNKDS